MDDMSTSGWTEWDFADEAPRGWSHHNVAVLDDNRLLAFHPGERQLLFFSLDGERRRAVDCDIVDAHDFALVGDGTAWVADCGHKLCVDDAGAVSVVPPVEDAFGKVVLVDLATGATLETVQLDRPFLPTGVVIDERGLWIADGYGANRVCLVDPAGGVLVTIDGFDCPHGIAVHGEHLYVAERGKNRLCQHGLDGAFVRHLGEGAVIAPCAIAIADDRLYVAEMTARVTVLSLDGEVLDQLGPGPRATMQTGWPNGATTPGQFNSPHGIAVDTDSIYVTEWRLGGRWIVCSR
jgi:DNA-binding beta-propeller fold protein YncE